MKRSSILTFLIGVAMVACAGVAARQDSLLPLAQKMYFDVRPEIVRGIAATGATSRPTDSAEAQMQALDAALEKGDRKAIGLVNWPILDLTARVGIAAQVRANEITEGVAGSLRERLSNFGLVLAKLAER